MSDDQEREQSWSRRVTKEQRAQAEGILEGIYEERRGVLIDDYTELACGYVALRAKVERFESGADRRTLLAEHYAARSACDTLQGENAKLRAKVERFKTMSTIEIMCENANVDDHVREWEARCLKAEQALQTRFVAGKIESLRHLKEAVHDIFGHSVEYCPACKVERFIQSEIDARIAAEQKLT